MLVALCIGCATQQTTETDEDIGDLGPVDSAEALYKAAKGQLDRGDFLGAIEGFETLEARYPFGNYTQQAQLDVAYAYLRQDEFDNAVAASERFIKLYPLSENVDYAWYMKGLANFARGGSTLERLFPRDMAQVDQNWLRASFAAFDTLITRYPESVYTPDAIERMQFLHSEMARHELLTAQYYYKRGAMVAVINRVQHMLTHYDGSKYSGNALALMASAYNALGQVDLEQDTLRILALNEPDHPAIPAELRTSKSN